MLRVVSVFPRDAVVVGEAVLLQKASLLPQIVDGAFVVWSNDEQSIVYDPFESEDEAADAHSCSGDYSALVVGIEVVG